LLPEASQVAACGALLAGGFPDRIGQRQAGKDNTFALSNGRGAAFALAPNPNPSPSPNP